MNFELQKKKKRLEVEVLSMVMCNFQINVGRLHVYQLYMYNVLVSPFQSKTQNY